MANKHRAVARRDFITGTALAGLAIGMRPTRASAAVGAAATTPEQALSALRAGNARFVSGNPTCADLTNRRAQLVGGQSPFAIIVSCSDSRVPVETVFDQEPGHIFGVRIAGNFVTTEGLGSIEYAIAELKSPLIVVLGHDSCGAVKAAIEYVKNGTAFPGHIQSLAHAIAPAAKQSKSPDDWLSKAIVQNVRDTVASLPSRSTIVADAVSSHKLRIVGGVYALSSGKVTLFAG